MSGVFEGVGIALASLRAHKMRAALTILGVAIGVTVVMVIGALISGFNKGISDMLASLGPKTFWVGRYWGGQNDEDPEDPNPWRRRPPITVDEAVRLVHGNWRTPAPRIRIFRILIVLTAPIAPDPEGLGAERRQHVRDALVEATDQRADHHDDRHADRDAKNRERRAHLVRAQRCESNADAFEYSRHALLLPQRGDRIEPRSPARGVYAGHDADAGPHDHTQHDRRRRHARGERRELVDHERQPDAGNDTERGADRRNGGRLGEKLAQHVAPPRAQRLPQPDLAR